MLSIDPAAVVAVTAAVSAAFASVLWRRKRRLTSRKGYTLPPGPPTPWFWASAAPIVNISETFVEWANVYGPVITLRRGGEIAIVITRVDAATEIMEKEGSALADRPPMIAANELLSGGKRISLTPSGERFRRLRKAVHTHFQARAVERYEDIQFEQAMKFLLDIFDDPGNHQKHTHGYSTSVILRVTYGKSSSTSTDDPDFVGVKQVVAHFIEGMRPGAYLVDRFAWLKYVPGYGKRLKGYHDSDLKFYRAQLSRVEHMIVNHISSHKSNVADKNASDGVRPSFARTLLESVHDHQLSFDEMAFLAGTIFEAGSDTTADAIIAMTMAAACFPGAQQRVQEELDTVVGLDRLPSWSDWDALPQLHAFISEALRWRPITPIGFEHRSTRDIIWKGYCIPSGTTVTGNQWAISRDPVAFPDPEKFDPQRWLDADGQLRKDVECYAFGFGRRICPGMHFANRSIFIALVLLLWTFRIVERPDAPIDTTPDKDNVVAHLARFEIDFVPRVAEARLREMIDI